MKMILRRNPVVTYGPLGCCLILLYFSSSMLNKIYALNKESQQTSLLTEDTWRDQDNHIISLQNKYSGKVLMVFVGYTSCPSLCPMITGQMKRLEEELLGQKLSEELVQILFISIDNQDTSVQLKSYAQKHQLNLKRWTLAQSTPEIKLRLTQKLGLSWDPRSENEKAKDHLRHSFSLIVIDPLGKVYKSYHNIFNLDIKKVGSEITQLVNKTIPKS